MIITKYSCENENNGSVRRNAKFCPGGRGRQHPQLCLNIDFSDHHVDLVERGIDLAIRIADLVDSSLQARRLCPIRILLCASPVYLEAFGTPERPQDLQNHKLLCFDAGHGSALHLSGPDGKSYVVQNKPSMMANNGDFLRDMAVAGHGIVMVKTRTGINSTRFRIEPARRSRTL